MVYWWESQKERDHWQYQDVIEMGWGSVDWIGLAQDWGNWQALVNAVMYFRVQ
jgi:hypothetical protein